MRSAATFAELAATLEAELRRLGVPDGAALVLAVSGGADSMALLHLAVRAAPRHRWRPVVAHLDHALRPDSADDAAFVRSAAEALGLEARLVRTDVAALADERGEGLEEAGRVARYRFLDEVARDLGPQAVVLTAHTADDQAETLLLHLARGAGLAGLSGIAERRDRVLRPLLGLRRAALRAALDAAGVVYRTDSTNADTRFARNRARAELVPAFERLHPGAVDALARAARTAGREDRLLDAVAQAELAARRAADGWIAWMPPPPPALGLRVLRAAVGSPAPSAERTAAVHAAAEAGRAASIELGHGRRAVVRRRRVRILLGR